MAAEGEQLSPPTPPVAAVPAPNLDGGDTNGQPAAATDDEEHQEGTPFPDTASADLEGEGTKGRGGEGEESKEPEPEEPFREAKRRRTSPAVLMKPSSPAAAPELSSAVRGGGGLGEADGEGGGLGFSFSFDVQALASPVEETPRFGSLAPMYNSAAAVEAADLGAAPAPAEIGVGGAEAEEGKRERTTSTGK